MSTSCSLKSIGGEYNAQFHPHSVVLTFITANQIQLILAVEAKICDAYQNHNRNKPAYQYSRKIFNHSEFFLIFEFLMIS